jgi:hypothetical protein
MRRRDKPLSAEFSDPEPPRELLRFVPSDPPPTMPDGRPMPWAAKWTVDEFAAFLRARTAWRNAHTRPLPRLPARERLAMAQLGIPKALINAENVASRDVRPPPYEQSGVLDRPASPVFSTSEEVS